MKIKTVMKNPDNISFAIDQAVMQSDLSLQEIEEAVKPWIKYGEYLSIEIDTEKRTAMNIPITANYPHNEDGSIVASGLVPSFEQWLASIESIDMDESSIIERQAARIDKLEKLVIEARLPVIAFRDALRYHEVEPVYVMEIDKLLERMRNT